MLGYWKQAQKIQRCIMLQYCSVSIAFITTDKKITPAQTSYPSCKIEIGKEQKKKVYQLLWKQMGNTPQ
jgi:hypothetical protein